MKHGKLANHERNQHFVNISIADFKWNFQLRNRVFDKNLEGLQSFGAGLMACLVNGTQNLLYDN